MCHCVGIARVMRVNAKRRQWEAQMTSKARADGTGSCPGRPSWRAGCASVVLALSALAASAAPGPEPQPDASTDDLQGVSLACDRAATHTVLDVAAASFCS